MMLPATSYASYSSVQIPSQVTLPNHLSQVDKAPNVLAEFDSKKWVDELLKLSPELEPSIRNEYLYRPLTHTQPGLGFDSNVSCLLPLGSPLDQQITPKLTYAGSDSAYWYSSSCQQNYPWYSARSLPYPTRGPWILPRLECVEPPYPYVERRMLPIHNDDQQPLALREPLTCFLKYVFPVEAHHCKKSSDDKEKSRVSQKRHQSSTGTRHYTKTLYDPKMSYHLNKLLFDTIGNDRKPTKSERYYIEKKTGISSRRLTYWLSNHKCRFQLELRAYRRLCLEGQIYSFDTFLEYCQQHTVPELKGRSTDFVSIFLSNEALLGGEKPAYCDDDQLLSKTAPCVSATT
ncbi:hypothetical protein BJV82DRAFT_665774 [Fennellomyces sp. T-0311]|nr:hypothetical protein BJV82DRAFT_665774 [Fennellomyces sp. T-0311]